MSVLGFAEIKFANIDIREWQMGLWQGRGGGGGGYIPESLKATPLTGLWCDTVSERMVGRGEIS